MCLLFIAHDSVPGYRLIVAANRDEFHVRPSAAAHYWTDVPRLLAGRDLEGGGTWLGLTNTGRFATVTNVRAGHVITRGPRSRGLIVSDFLTSSARAIDFAVALAGGTAVYDGFNLLAWDGSDLVWISNRSAAVRALPRGRYTLSNAELDAPWPKSLRLRANCERVLAKAAGDPIAALLEVLRDATRAADAELPVTGLDHARESALSSIFIEGGSYGTRASTVVTIDRHARVRFHERRYDANGGVQGDSAFDFELGALAA
jgi:uncharacterized protein with NRDE domain